VAHDTPGLAGSLLAGDPLGQGPGGFSRFPSVASSGAEAVEVDSLA
jgi:hypothetical protein